MSRSHSSPIVNKNKINFKRYSHESDMLIPRPSILLPQLQDTEQRFFELVSTDVRPVQHRE
ncbi:unnamed protein product [Acanthoscelides obtectus]|uniref:Uncharacterized protein n=1 Tax=Acanthoscelides obtectus TaxID=200917 RepID=A0A9P0LT64_ACAOB|nr:unnamed protein product [Acanthoscelides obtectus]CAK1670719.1 hypothetical protein AOBTE_LOCUS27789 [Acanthoscelides obtectus]